jgi:hypothetical protein
MKSVAHVARLTNFTMIRQFFRSSSDITWPNFTNARCTQAMTPYKLIITHYRHITQQAISLNIENLLLISLYKITSLQEIHLVQLFIQLQAAKDLKPLHSG